jgi:tetratricopeptide (TPR) repeat protein
MLLVLACFLGGYAPSWYFRELAPGEESRDVPAPGKIPKADPETPAALLGPADRFLQRGDYRAALDLFLRFTEQAGTAPGHRLAYRTALCLEGLGDYAGALKTYRAALRADPEPTRKTATEIGIARCLVHLGQIDSAEPMLLALVLNSAAADRSPAAATESRFLLAHVLSRRALPKDFLASGLPLAMPGFRPPSDLTDESTPQGQPAEETLQVAGKELATVVLRHHPAYEIMQQLGVLASRPLAWTPHAAERAHERRLTVAVKDGRVPELLGLLAVATGNLLVSEGTTFRIMTVEEAAPTATRTVRQALARTALLEALRQAPGHRLAAGARLELAYQELAAGRSAAAKECCEKLLRECPSSAVAVQAAYHRARLSADEGEPIAARKWYLRVTDLSPAHELAQHAQIELARLYLAELNRAAALSCLRRVPDAAIEPELQVQRTLLRAAAHVLGTEDSEARTVLHEQHAALAREPWRQTALLLEALAHFRLSRARGFARHEAAELVALLANEPVPTPPLGAVHRYIAGIAFRELGLWEELARHHAHVRQGLTGPLAPLLALEQGECLLRLGRLDAAQTCFNSLLQDPRHGAAAELRLAEVNLLQGDTEGALRRCKQLWDSDRIRQSGKLFEIWAAAFEQTGDFDNASRCLQGQPPE